jgi:hypothetical protein
MAGDSTTDWWALARPSRFDHFVEADKMILPLQGIRLRPRNIPPPTRASRGKPPAPAHPTSPAPGWLVDDEGLFSGVSKGTPNPGGYCFVCLLLFGHGNVSLSPRKSNIPIERPFTCSSVL